MEPEDFGKIPKERLNADKLNEEIKEKEKEIEEENNNSQKFIGKKRSNDSTEGTSENNQSPIFENARDSQPEKLIPKKKFGPKKKKNLNKKCKVKRKEKNTTSEIQISNNFLIFEGPYSGVQNEVFEEKKRNEMDKYNDLKNQLKKLKEENKVKTQQYRELEEKKKKYENYFEFLKNFKILSDKVLEKNRNLMEEIQIEEGIIDNCSILTSEKVNGKKKNDLLARENLQLICNLSGLLKLLESNK